MGPGILMWLNKKSTKRINITVLFGVEYLEFYKDAIFKGTPNFEEIRIL